MSDRYTKTELYAIIASVGLQMAIESINAEDVDDAYLSRAWAKARAAFQEIKAKIPELNGA